LAEIAGTCNGIGYPHPELPIVSFLQPGIDYEKITNRVLQMITKGTIHIRSIETEIDAKRREEELRIKLQEDERLRKIKEEQDSLLDAL